MNTGMVCMRTYGSQESLKRHMRYAHNENKIRCRWCPYEISSNVRFRMRDHERSQDWYRFLVEQAAELKENSSKYRNHKSKKGERKKHTAVSTMKSTVNKICDKKGEEIKKLFNEGIPKYIATPIPPLREPSPVDTDFKELVATKLTVRRRKQIHCLVSTETKDEPNEKGIGTKEHRGELDEGKSDRTEINYTTTDKEDLPAEKDRGTDEEGAMEIAEIGELEEGGSAEPEINNMTTIEIPEEVLQKLEEDIRLVEIDAKVTVTDRKYGRIYDHKHHLVPEEKNSREPRHVLACPPSSYSLAEETALLRCLREGARRMWVSTLFIGVKNVPKADGENISTAISNLMTERFQETWKEKLVAMGTDGVSVMLGKTSGVVKRIKDMTSRPVYAIHCSAHRIELAYKDAIKGTKIWQRCDALMLNIYLYSKSIQTMTWTAAADAYMSTHPNLFMLIDYLLTLPSSSVDAERGCSR
ncbi:Hypothetical predicted protein [Mytilus galloprovincialis]|uniref:Uncharacterized protein n=1 Tax=Mytilus galloprovincialis TaxID=29158 RepID=A0A8B6D286_MYTGA|nr:Hypothetical predicted protein [Mytilus galloprovincialis]